MSNISCTQRGSIKVDPIKIHVKIIEIVSTSLAMTILVRQSDLLINARFLFRIQAFALWMMPIPVYKYIDSGCMIQIDFLSFQSDHPHVTCYVTVGNCLMILHLVSIRYIVEIWDIETGSLIYSNPAGWDKAVDVLSIKYPEHPEDATLQPIGFAAEPHTYPTSAVPLSSEVVENDISVNGEWKQFVHDPSRATQELIPEGLVHVANHGRIKTNFAVDSSMLNGCDDRDAYLKLFARHGGGLDTNICFKVYANQPVYLHWATDRPKCRFQIAAQRNLFAQGCEARWSTFASVLIPMRRSGISTIYMREVIIQDGMPCLYQIIRMMYAAK